MRAQFAQPDDATVGVAAPIAIQFDGPVTDKAAAERALHGAHVGAHRGVLGVAARRRAGLTGALAAEGVLAARHRRRRRGEPVRGGPGRRRLRARGPHQPPHRRALADRAGRRHEPPDGRDPGRSAGHGRARELRAGQRPQPHHAQRDPRRHREVRQQADDQRAVRLRPRRALGRAHEQQRRVHPRQPGVGRTRRARATSPTAASTSRPPTPGRTTTPPSTATPSRSRTPRSSSPPPTGTSTTGPSTGTPGAGCRR